MPYEAKTDWKYDDLVTEKDMNRIEQGLKDAHVPAYQPLTLNPGLQVVEVENDTPFRMGEVKGRTLVNLLGRAGAFDAIDPWRIYGGNGNVSEGLFIITGDGTASNPQVLDNLNTVHTPEVGELLFLRTKSLVDNDKCLEIGLYLYAANANPARIYAGKLKNPSPNQVYEFGGLIRVTQNMVENWEDMRIVVAYEYSSAEDALNTVNKVSKVAMYKIPESASGLSVSELLVKYPYVDRMTNVTNPYAIVTGGNLLPPFTEWGTEPNAMAKAVSPYEAIAEITSDGTKAPLRTIIPVFPNTVYTVSSEGNSIPENGLQIIERKDANDGDPSGEIEGGYWRSVPGGVAVGTVTFTTTAQTHYLAVRLRFNKAGIYTIKKPLLIPGTEPKPFTRQQRSILAFETELAAHPVYGSNPDILFMGDDGLPYVLEPWKKVTLDGGLDWRFAERFTGFKTVLAYGATAGAVAGSGFTTKYDGKKLGIAGNWVTDGPDNINGDIHLGSIYISVANTDSGWGPDYTPTQDEIKAYFLGWKMFDGQNDPTAVGVYNRSDGLHKYWTPLDSFDGVNFNGGYEGSGVPNDIPNPANTNRNYIKHRHWQPYRLQYLKAKPTVEPVRNYELGATLSAGSNMVEVGSGIVIRERANPSANIGWNHAVINRVDGDNGHLKNRVSKFYGVYRNEAEDKKWVEDSQGGLAYGLKALVTDRHLFDPTAVYHVTYTRLNPTIAAPINGTVAANLRGTVSDLVQDVGDVQRRLSVVETQKAEKDSKPPEWIKPTLLNGWTLSSNGVFPARYYKDGVGIVHVNGIVTGGTTETVVFRLPSGYRPNTTIRTPSIIMSGTNVFMAYLDVKASGDVIAVFPTQSTHLTLQMSFLAEQ
ncbi:hypothetical protein FLT15_05065 [Paenibacillus thiaminolyticus]|uniref:hypothetical protein n=1 Tax=Paenibacillus thiaminolyticus TaxID=49283 RepID=UPI00116566E7|nr:hypothetical protein [Paenibacillus thiaminolyticus]NGP57784.1 hypothetical protein [Paenibacillus thiaminolyticus]